MFNLPGGLPGIFINGIKLTTLTLCLIACGGANKEIEGIDSVSAQGSGSNRDFAPNQDSIPNDIDINTVPELSFSQPLPNATFEVDDDIFIEVMAADEDGNIESIELFIGESLTLIGEDSEPPYQWSSSEIPELAL